MFVRTRPEQTILLNKLVRLNKAALYDEEFVNAEIKDCGHFINSASEILDYDRDTEKISIRPNDSSFNEFTKYVQQYYYKLVPKQF